MEVDFSCSERVVSKPKKSIQKKLKWEVYRLKAWPAAFIGIVYAHDEKAALKASAIKEFEIAPASKIGY